MRIILCLKKDWILFWSVVWMRKIGFDLEKFVDEHYSGQLNDLVLEDLNKRLEDKTIFILSIKGV